jgi:ketosteroid isomerase-like protein
MTPLALARAWLDAFNAHDVDALVALYADDATHTSPKIRALHPDTGGKLVGKVTLAAWWRDANRRLPGLRYEPTAIVADETRAIIEYLRHAPDEAPMPVAEAFDVRGGKIVASRVYHG